MECPFAIPGLKTNEVYLSGARQVESGNAGGEVVCLQLLVNAMNLKSGMADKEKSAIEANPFRCCPRRLACRKWVSFRGRFLVPIRINHGNSACLVQPGHLAGRQIPADGAEIFAELLFVARADDQG